MKDLDYRKFLRSKNPLAYALMAKMGYDRRQMVQTKSEFCRLIAGSKKINPARRYLLLEFVEAYMQLNRQEQKTYDQMIDEQKEFKEVKKMITVYEKRGMEQGLEQGLLEGKREALLLLLKSRFGFIDNELEDRIMHLSSVAKVDKLLKKAAVVEDVKTLKL